jgi:hypothetical protein
VRTLRRRHGDDSGSLGLAMLVMIAGVGLSGVIMASTMQVIQGARSEQTQTAVLQAARAGIGSALATVRSAVDLTNGLGLLDKLPCGTYSAPGVTTFPPQVIGKLSTNARYDVWISYLIVDPTAHDETWISANSKPCATTLTALPNYAYVKSTGTVSGRTQTLFGVYSLRTVVNANRTGGQIRGWHAAGAADLCLDAGSTPAPGSYLRMQPCATDSAGDVVGQQQFAYQPGLQITLVTADKTLYPNGLCADAGLAQTAGSKLALQNCASSKLGATQQQWSFNFAGGFVGSTIAPAVVCWHIDTPVAANSFVTLNDKAGTNGTPACNASYPNNIQTWVPSSAVGSGGAGLPIPTAQLYGYQVRASQLTNYQALGRCLGVTNSDVASTFEILTQCKQSPTFDLKTNWDQGWATPQDGATGQIYTYSDPKQNFYCLIMPPVPSSPMLVTVRLCTPGWPRTDEVWWMRGNSTTSPAKNYRIEGVGAWAGLCLGTLPAVPDDKGGLLPCTSDKLQKWNVVASATPAGLSGIGTR